MNITYYLGAGASCNALPLYKDFKVRLEVFRDFIYHYGLENKDNDFKAKLEVYLKSLGHLIRNLNENESSSVDALAYELYNRKNNNGELSFNKLKYLISDFFVFEQLQKEFDNYETQSFDIENFNGYKPYDQQITNNVNTFIDRRYRTFINAEIDKTTLQFPNNINFISWNYDLQMELAYARIRDFSLLLAQNNLQVFPSPGTSSNFNPSKSALIKLNGTAGIYYSEPTIEFSELQNAIADRPSFANSYIDYMIEIFYNNYSRIMGSFPFFTFAFEKEIRRQARLNSTIEYANSIMKKTDTLIVIGYSFHPLNREIDKAVFNDLLKLNRIIIQVPSQESYNEIAYNLRRITSLKPEPFLNGREFLASNNI